MKPVLSVAREVLEAQGTVCAAESLRDEAEFLFVSYRSGFDTLWRLDRVFLDWARTRNRRIVIEWDGGDFVEDLGGVPVGDYLTPVDWTVALLLLLESQGACPRVIVLDSARRGRLAQSVALARSSPRLLPMLQVFAIDDIDGFRLAVHAPASPPEPADPDLVRSVWRDALVSPAHPEDRHAVSNLVGPRVLTGAGNEAEVVSKGARAFMTLLRALQLLPASAAPDPEPWFERCEWETGVRRFILVDDLYAAGWDRFLRQALDLRDDSELVCVDDPSAAFQLRGGNLHLAGSRDGDVLFLDLRLFASGGVPSEFKFLRELIELAAGMPISRRDLPWPGFSQADLEAMRAAAAEQVRETSGYHLLLTLPARLLALAHPRLPIVLFSSTGRREMIEELRPYENVILDFSKPRFFGVPWEYLVSQSRAQFREAMHKAAGIAAGASRLAAIERAAVVRVKDPAQGTTTVQVYANLGILGETLAAGGLAFVSPDGRSVTAMNRRLAEADLARDDHAIEDLVRAQNLQRDLETVRRSAEEVGIQPLAFVLTLRNWREEDAAAPGVAGAARCHLLARILLSEALEVLLFDRLFPWLADIRQAGFDLGSALYDFDGAGRETLQSDFSVPANKDGSRLRVLGGMDALSVGAAVASFRPAAALPLARARTVVPATPAADPVHALVSRVVGAAPEKSVRESCPTLAVWLGRGFLAQRNKRFLELLGASRNAAADPVGSILTVLGKGDASPLENSLRAGAARWSKRLDGAAFVELCRRWAGAGVPLRLQLWNPGGDRHGWRDAARRAVLSCAEAAGFEDSPEPPGSLIATMSSRTAAMQVIQARNAGRLRILGVRPALRRLADA